VYSATNNVVLVNGQPTMPVDVQAETSTNIDVGYRLQSDKLTAQATAYAVNFRDRQATAYDPVANMSSLTSVGKVKTYGFELEMGNTPVNGFSFYGSIGYANSEIQDDILVSKTATLPTKGKRMTLTPEWKAGYGLSISKH
jgi:iron complex outermembrane receptor protein